MDQIQSLKDLINYYNATDSRYIYFDKTFDIRGIDYTKFIQLKYESINHIKDKYSIDGWYILWYLMSRAIKNEYLAITINSISEETNLKAIKIKEAIQKLIYHEVILCNKNITNINNNDLLQIYIGYNNNLCSHITQNGYNPIPNNFIYYIISSLSPIEFGIYCVLLTKYNYYLAWEYINKTTGEIIPIYQRTHYAFPTQTQIGNYLGITDDTVNKFINRLLNSKYDLITKEKSQPNRYWDEENNKWQLRGGNNRYKIKLYERPEYIYYYYNMNFDKQTQEEYNKIRNKGFENIALSNEQYLIQNKKLFYIKYYFGETIKLYEKCIKTKNYDLYKDLRQNNTLKL